MKQTIWRAYCMFNSAALVHPRLLSWFGDGTFGANLSPSFETSRMGNISNLLKQMVSRQTLKKTTFPVHSSDPVQSHDLCMESMEYLFANAWALPGAAGWRHMTFFIFAIERLTGVGIQILLHLLNWMFFIVPIECQMNKPVDWGLEPTTLQRLGIAPRRCANISQRFWWNILLYHHVR